ncbi:MAG: hypothetical protein QE277_11265 [Flectobacillus sp.]|jgi:hypothetical protein|nr:hypothetical protein [Flectobacillus sp.]
MAKFTKEEQIKMLENKLKELKASNIKEQRKLRAKKLIEIGAYVASAVDIDTVHQMVQNDSKESFKHYIASYYPFKTNPSISQE